MKLDNIENLLIFIFKNFDIDVRNTKIILKLIQGFTYKQISEELKVSPSLIRQIYFKTIKKLRKLSYNYHNLLKKNILLEKIFLDDNNRYTNLTIDFFDFSRRVNSSLITYKILTLKDLILKNENEILKLKHIGKKGLEEIKNKLKIYNLKLKDN